MAFKFDQSKLLQKNGAVLQDRGKKNYEIYLQAFMLHATDRDIEKDLAALMHESFLNPQPPSPSPNFSHDLTT